VNFLNYNIEYCLLSNVQQNVCKGLAKFAKNSTFIFCRINLITVHTVGCSNIDSSLNEAIRDEAFCTLVGIVV
jgi:hypothetical protein